MVWTMKSLHPRSRIRIGRAWNVVFVSVGIFLAAMLPAGCGGGKQVRLAPPSSHALDSEQESRMTAILVEVADASPSSSAHLDLLPAHGIRWTDVPRAMDKAAEESNMAVLRSRTVDKDHVLIQLVSIQGWPAVVRVQRLPDAPWIAAEALVGPWPEEPALQRRASTLQSSFLDWMHRFGKMKRVPEWTVGEK